MPNDIGGGNRGEGGPLSDAFSLLKPNPNSGRSLQDYQTRSRIESSFVATQLASLRATLLASNQYLHQVELDDFLVTFAFQLISGEAIADPDNNIVIAKPPELRASVFDNSQNGTLIPTDPEIDIITYLGGGRRKVAKLVDEGILERFEIISPPYEVGSLIYATTVNTTDLGGITLQDLNVTGRRWVDEEPEEKRFIIKNILKDHFECYVYQDGEEIIPDNPAEYTLVAKPHELRGSYWESLAWNDGVGVITYQDLTSDGDYALRRANRTGGATEDQIVLPPWIIDSTIITAQRINNGTGVASVLWEANGPWAFAEKFVES